MTHPHAYSRPVFNDPEAQPSSWFLGSLSRTQLSSTATHDTLAVLDHRGKYGYSSPLHRHLWDDETFLVLDGTLEVIADGQEHTARTGSALFLPRRSVHAFVVTSTTARFLTVHTPGGFDRFTDGLSTPAPLHAFEQNLPAPSDAAPPTRHQLAQTATRYGIEILGPAPLPRPIKPTTPQGRPRAHR